MIVLLSLCFTRNMYKSYIKALVLLMEGRWIASGDSVSPQYSMGNVLCGVTVLPWKPGVRRLKYRGANFPSSYLYSRRSTTENTTPVFSWAFF